MITERESLDFPTISPTWLDIPPVSNIMVWGEINIYAVLEKPKALKFLKIKKTGCHVNYTLKDTQTKSKV